MKVRVVDDHSIVSNSFIITTEQESVSNLINADTVSAERTSAIITVDVESSSDLIYDKNNETIDTYSLEVIDSEGALLGESDANDLTTNGTQTFNLTGLKSNKNYIDVKIRVKDDTSIISNDFNIVTKKESVSKLTDADTTSTTSDSAVISVKVESTTSYLNEETQNYSLEIIDSNNVVIGKSDANDLTTDGDKTINLTELEANKTYSNVKVRVKNDTSIVSNTFDIITQKKSVSALSEAKMDDSDNKSAIISVNVEVPTNNLNEEINLYSLEVIENNTDVTIGDSSAIDLNTPGLQTFTLSNLETNKHYGDVQVRVEGTSIVSGPFDLWTKKDSILSLEDISVDSLTREEATINVTTNINKSSNTETENYVLVVIDEDDDNKVLGESEILTNDGKQTIRLTGLYSEHNYKNTFVQVKGTSISSKIDQWETQPYPFKIEDDSFIIDDESKTKNSFVFSISIDCIGSGDIRDFITSDLQLFSNGKDSHDLGEQIMLEFISISPKDNGSDATFSYKAIKLTPNKNYDNFKTSFKQLDTKDKPPIDMDGHVKTKVNPMLYVEISASSLILIAVIALVSTLIYIWRKRRKRDFFTSSLKFM